MEEALRLSYREDTVIAEIGGEIDHHRAVSVRTQIDEALFAHMPKKLIIDIGKVDFMDSSGLGLIMGRLAKSKEIGASLILQNPSARVMRMLKMAGLDRIIPTTKNCRKCSLPAVHFEIKTPVLPRPRRPGRTPGFRRSWGT